MPPAKPDTSIIGMNIEQARFNMVEQQIRTWEVLDQNVLDLLFAVRREEFVPPAHRLLAFADLELPLGGGAAMWSPKMEARVLQELQLTSGESVLEIGTGSGYFAGLLAAMGARVTSVEIDPLLASEAALKLQRTGFDAELHVGDGSHGWGAATYDAIVLTGSTPVMPDGFIGQLNPGGRVFAVIGEAPVMEAKLIRWVAPGTLSERTLFETVIRPLTNAPVPAHFEF